MKKLREPKATLPPFLDRIGVLAPRLGPILFQLPPHWRLDHDRLRHFLLALPREYRYAFEFRDSSWWVPAVYNLLADHEAAFCIHDLDGVQSPREVTSDLVYVRLHGSEGRSLGSYDGATLLAWLEAFSAWAAQGRLVYCYFDNDQSGHAAQNALQMQEMILETAGR